MNLIVFFCIAYYVFSVYFMAGYLSETDEENPWITLLSVVLGLLFAPILFPINLGKAIKYIVNKL